MDDSDYHFDFDADSSSDDDEDEFTFEDQPTDNEDEMFTWTNVPPGFTPRKQLPGYKKPETTIDENTSPTDVFLKLFPRSLFMWISECTNQRYS